MKNKHLKIAIGISGGVDSATTAFLLKQQGYDVVGIFMQNWDSFANYENYDNHKDHCDSYYEYQDAKKICDFLNIELIKVDFIKEYWDEVFSDFIKEYKAGRTPNPDVLCNKYIKFGHLLKYAIDILKCDYLATGHYANVIHYDDHSELHLCKDANKDQTYFLCDLNQAQLTKALFPLNNLLKSEVREIAKKANLPVWDKKDSTGICFIGERNFQSFLSNYINTKEGDIVDIITNEVVGKHIGISYYTIGQNKDLHLSGCKHKYFVCKKDMQKNIIYVVDDLNKEKYLYTNHCSTEPFNFINLPKNNNDLKVRFRHRQELIDCKINLLENNEVEILCNKKAFAITEGQYAVLYEGNNCLGGGIVKKVFYDN